ncbi:delta-like protein 1 isoform X1 [Patiria miniata]|uniref:Delta-like protein n=1 Tax=Patiria miniata TaxID=46514 RepID=A0A913ZZ10_PATMI|nr:delta-like protein 1 isoform X1 [Patiria miniata]
MGRLRLSWRYITVLMVYFITVFTKVTGTERFELELSSFRNTLAADSQGNCCGTGSPGQCTAQCETFFRICLLEYMRDIPSDVENTQACTFGEEITPVLGDNTFDIPTGPSEENNFVNPLKVQLNFAWPGTFTLIIQAFHDVTSLGPAPGSERQVLTRVAFQQFLDVDTQWSNRTHTDEEHQHELNISYRVVCNENYYGPTCSNICRPKNDSLGHWRCDQNGQKVCLDGWEGAFCTIAICAEGCAHGTCTSAPGTCTCQYGWEGELCDQCIPYEGCVHGYCDTVPGECICNPGWGDLLCNQDLYYCTNHMPCKNGGTCENGGQPEGFTCYCAPGFTGIDCSVAVECPCQNGGTCQSTENGYACACPSGFTGMYCDTILVPTCCSNGGTCITTQDGHQCLCPQGFVGNRCETRDYCSSSPCVNGGTCVNTLSGFYCDCPNGYTGSTCSRNVCSADMCKNGGTCVADFDTLRCVCPRRFTGAQCETELTECQLTAPCAHGATCVDHEVNGYECLCHVGYTGRNCTVPTACLPNQCLNGGTCSPDLTNPLDFVCTCPAGWIGKTCGIAERHDVTASTTTLEPSVTPGSTTNDRSSASSLGGNGGGDVGTSSPYIHTSYGLSDVTQIAIYVSFGVLIIILIIILIIVVYRRQHVDHSHARGARDVEKTDSTPNNRHMYRDNFSQEEKVLPLLSISSKVCNTESDNFSKSKCKDYSAKETYHESLPVEKISTQECMSYVQRHSLPRLDAEDSYYYYDEKASQLKRTESLHSTCQSTESTPRHNIKCSIVQISAVIEESNPKSVNRNSQCYSVHLNEERSTPARLQATEV